VERRREEAYGIFTLFLKAHSHKESPHQGKEQPSFHISFHIHYGWSSKKACKAWNGEQQAAS